MELVSHKKKNVDVTIFTDNKGKESRYKRDIVFGDINYEEFKNYSLVILPIKTTGRPDFTHNSILEWNREIYSPDINLLKELLEEKGKLKLKGLQEEIEKFQDDLNTAIEKYKNL